MISRKIKAKALASFGACINFAQYRLGADDRNRVAAVFGLVVLAVQLILLLGPWVLTGVASLTVAAFFGLRGLVKLDDEVLDHE